MNNQELKDALLQRTPVYLQGVRYARVSAIIYRAVNGSIVVTAELMDITERSVTIVEPRRVSLNKEG